MAKRRKKQKSLIPFGIRKTDVVAFLMPQAAWNSVVEEKEKKNSVGFKTMTIEGIRTLPCPWVNDVCVVVKAKVR